MTNRATEVIIKAENHNSELDLREGRKILNEGVDHYIIENKEREADYPLKYRWFQFLLWTFRLLIMNRFVYTDHSSLTDIADRHDANKIATRETDLELIDDAPVSDKLISFMTFAVFVGASLFIGLSYDNVYVLLTGGLVYLCGMVIPVMFLRVRESEREYNNRDQKIAKKITAAANDGGRVVAILGKKHCNPVMEKIPEEIEIDFRPTLYNENRFQQILNNLKLVMIAVPLYLVFYFVLILIVRTV